MQVTVAEILADEKRVAVLDALRDRDVTAHDIAQLMGLPASAASYHIKQMVLAGVLMGTRSDDDARVVYYRRIAAPIRTYVNRLQSLFGEIPPRTSVVPTALDRRWLLPGRGRCSLRRYIPSVRVSMYDRYIR